MPTLYLGLPSDWMLLLTLAVVWLTDVKQGPSTQEGLLKTHQARELASSVPIVMHIFPKSTTDYDDKNLAT